MPLHSGEGCWGSHFEKLVELVEKQKIEERGILVLYIVELIQSPHRNSQTYVARTFGLFALLLPRRFMSDPKIGQNIPIPS